MSWAKQVVARGVASSSVGTPSLWLAGLNLRRALDRPATYLSRKLGLSKQEHRDPGTCQRCRPTQEALGRGSESVRIEDKGTWGS